MRLDVWMGIVLLLAVAALPQRPGCDAAETALREVIDRHMEDGWAAHGVQPAGAATDAEFLRRVYLDLIGVIPSYDAALAFLDDSADGKRGRLISELLEHPRFGLHQADVWDMVYFGRNPPGFGTRDRDEFRQWLQRQLQQNVPYDQWVRQILRAEGNTVEQGPPMFFVQYRNAPEDAIEAVTRRFLGVQLQCARCHDHPFDEWTQLDFYGMAAFLARLQVVDVGKRGESKSKAYAIGEKNLGEVMFTGPVTEDEVGKKGRPVQPKFLHGGPLEEPELPEDFQEDRNFPNGKAPPAPKFSRKDALADWIVAADNPYFARAAVNRVWAQFMGRGIVHPVDNLSPDNPPRYPQLLDALAEAFVAHDFDLKWLIAEILNSRAYQQSGAGESTAAMPQWYQRARCRPLSAEELFESWLVATGFDRTLEQRGEKIDERFNRRGFTWDYLRRAFGQPNDGVGNFQGGLQEHLYLNNGQVRQLISTRPGGLHAALLESEAPWDRRVEQLYLHTLSRRPSTEEREKFVAFLTADDDTSGRLHDAIWTLVTCSEFRFNH